MPDQGILAKISFIRQKLLPWRLSSLGIRLSPYYVYQEGLFSNEKIIFGDEFDVYETCFLDIEDMDKLHYIDGREASKEKLCHRLQRGNKCFAVTLHGDIVGFTWCDFEKFVYPPKYKFSLKDNEAYLFDAYILKSFRGQKLGPFMRYRCYHELEKLDKRILYSYSDYHNEPAIRFKEKLRARRLRFCVQVTLFQRFYWNFTLKNYGHAGQ